MRETSLGTGWTVVVDAAVWAVWGVLVGYVMHRVPADRLARDCRLTRLRPFEQDGRFWERRLRIRRWKRYLPEAGAFFDGGFDKKRLRAGDPAHLERFVIETRRAELTHWAVLALAPVFVLWNPPGLAAAMIVYGVVANVPCLVTQRYNRARLERVLRQARVHA